MSAEPPLDIRTLPLFPLHSVLFPQFLVQLHVFEERYKVMINRCIEKGEPFGIVLIRAGNEVGAPAVPYEVGCTARILGVEKLDEGRMRLLATGEQRFRLLDYVEADFPYLVGRVETLQDTPAGLFEEEDNALAQEAATQFRQYLTRLAERTDLSLPDFELPDDPSALSFCIAAIMQMPPEDKQRLLEMTDATERLRREMELLEDQMRLLDAAEPEAPQSQSAQIAPVNLREKHWDRYRQNSEN